MIEANFKNSLHFWQFFTDLRKIMGTVERFTHLILRKLADFLLIFSRGKGKIRYIKIPYHK
jgi:hypothetical protein